MNLEELLDVYHNAYGKILEYFDTCGRDHVDGFDDLTDAHWCTVRNQIVWFYEKPDLETVQELGPEYSCEILGKVLRKEDYTMIFMSLGTGDNVAGIFKNSLELDQKLVDILEDW